MDIHEILQTAGQYCYIVIMQIWEWIKLGWTVLGTWLSSLPWPTSIKLFSNNTVNKYLFFGVLAFLVLMNIRAFYLFAHDKASAKRRDRRTSENKLMRACFWGGAIGGIIGMNAFKHKTQKKKFAIGVPVLMIVQLSLYCFALGFLGFWAFF